MRQGSITDESIKFSVRFPVASGWGKSVISDVRCDGRPHPHAAPWGTYFVHGVPYCFCSTASINTFDDTSKELAVGFRPAKWEFHLARSSTASPYSTFPPPHSDVTSWELTAWILLLYRFDPAKVRALLHGSYACEHHSPEPIFRLDIT